MKKLFTLFFITAISITALAQKEADVLRKANELIAGKKYESAFKSLEVFDPKNEKPNVALLKTDIVLEYFVTSMSHQMFALKDLEPNETVADYRGTGGQFSMHNFAPNTVLEALIAKNPKNCALYKSLGNFYYEAYTHYAGNWLKPDTELFTLINTNLTKAIEGKCADYMSHYILGFIALSQEDYTASLPHLLKSIALNSAYATAHYNAAYAYLYQDDRKNAITHAVNAYNLYPVGQYKGDAARIAGQAYLELKDDANALKYYQMADAADPNNYYNLKALLGVYVRTGNKAAEPTRLEFYNLAPENTIIYSSLEEIYGAGKKETDLIAFYAQQLSKFNGNDKALGNIHFYTAALYLDTDNKKAHEELLLAKSHFVKVLPVDNDVFGIIEQGLEYTAKP